MKCSREGCDRKSRSRGLCHAHYESARLAGQFSPLEPVDTAVCKGCDAPAASRRMCHACHAKRMREWTAKNPGRSSRRAAARRFSVSLERYDEMLASPCWLCGLPLEELVNGRRPSIDHDRSCCPGRESCGNCVRGATHAACNLIIGMAKESPELLEGIARSLRVYLQGQGA